MIKLIETMAGRVTGRLAGRLTGRLIGRLIGRNTNTIKLKPGYASGIHSDAHPETADGVFAWVSVNVSWYYVYGRYMYLNVWRNIDDEGAVVDDHLAVLDQTSLTPGVGSEVWLLQEALYSASAREEQPSQRRP